MFIKIPYRITMQSQRQIKHIIYNINNKYCAVSGRPTRQAVIEMMSACVISVIGAHPDGVYSGIVIEQR